MNKKFKIPNVLSNERLEDQDYLDCWAAANKHEKQLIKAEEEIFTARSFCETLRGHLVQEEAYAELTVVEHIEKLICKARDRLDIQSTRHSNLFIAYFDLKGGAS